MARLTVKQLKAKLRAYKCQKKRCTIRLSQTRPNLIKQALHHKLITRTQAQARRGKPAKKSRPKPKVRLPTFTQPRRSKRANRVNYKKFYE